MGPSLALRTSSIAVSGLSRVFRYVFVRLAVRVFLRMLVPRAFLGFYVVASRVFIYVCACLIFLRL